MTANHRIVTEEIPKTWGPPLKLEKVFDGSSLVNVRVPFQPGTFDIKEDLKTIGFRCLYDKKYWEGPAASISEARELLKLAASSLDHKRKPPTAGLSTPSKPETKKRRRTEEDQKVALAGGATLHRRQDDFCEAKGSVLRNVAPLLTKILHFSRLSSAGAVYWQSKWPLTEMEFEFVVKVLKACAPKLESGSVDVKNPIPDDALPVPDRFRPVGAGGDTLHGPFVAAGKDRPWNKGRQYFRSSNGSGFLWADGTEGFGAEAQARCAHYMGDACGSSAWMGMMGMMFGGVGPCDLFEGGAFDEGDDFLEYLQEESDDGEGGSDEEGLSDEEEEEDEDDCEDNGDGDDDDNDDGQEGE